MIYGILFQANVDKHLCKFFSVPTNISVPDKFSESMIFKYTL